MNYSRSILFAAALLTVTATSAMAQDKTAATPAPAAKTAPAKSAPVKVAAKSAEKLGNVMKGGQPVCPITGEAFTPTASSDRATYKGKTYAFCCGGCKPQFEKNPAKYVTEAKPAVKTPKKKS